MPLPVGERAAAVLTLLIRRAGQLVTKDELMSFAWNDLAVEENNLTVQIASLRKMLRDGGGEPAWIETMPRRGYRFIGPVQPHQTAAGAAPRAMPAEAPRLAILPFRSRSPNHGDDLFATGIVEEIISLLASLREVTVLSFGTMATIDPQSTNLRDIGQSLGVRYTVTGAMWRSGNHLRLIVELTDCESGVVLWSRPYRLEQDMPFDAQEKIVAHLVDTLAPRVREAELRRMRIHRPEDIGCYHLVLRARDLLYRLDRDSFEEAGQLIRHAISRDAHYPAAHVLATEWHMLRVGQGWSLESGADVRLADLHALAAIQDDAANSRALAFHGHSRSFLQRDYVAAMDLFDRALDAAPNDAAAWGWSSPTFSFVGDSARAIERAERALDLSPSDPLGFRYRHFIALGHFTAGRYDDAIHWGLAAARAQPRYTANLRYTAAAMVAAGRIPEARDLAAQVMEIEPDFRVSPLVARHPYKDPARRKQVGDLLLMAGLPD
jgi:TolB-like protein